MKQIKKCLRLASDCSGMGTDMHAALQLGLKHRHIFASDSIKYCRKVLKLLLQIHDSFHLTVSFDLLSSCYVS